MSTENQEQLTEAQLKRRREGIPDRAIRQKAKQLVWKSPDGTLDQFMFALSWLRYGKGDQARWFRIER